MTRGGKRAGAGRPKLGAARKSSTVKVRTTKAEAEAWNERAAAAGFFRAGKPDRSAWLRSLANSDDG